MNVHRISPAVAALSVAVSLGSLGISRSVCAETPNRGHQYPRVSYDPPTPVCEPSSLDFPYIPVDSWVYQAIWRLYALGYIDTVYLGMRPWTRESVESMIEEAQARIEDESDSGAASHEAKDISLALRSELDKDMEGPCYALHGKARVESIYTVLRGLSGPPLHDSFHLGQSIINDYGRPYESGFNNYTGLSGYASAGRFQIYARGEFRGAPSASGYSTTLAETLSALDEIPFISPATGQPLRQATIPLGPIDSKVDFRLIEAYASARVLNHEISFGKQDEWMGPGMGASMAYSNNAENIYSFRINRVEPLRIPLLSRLTGPFRYDFLVGPTKGHSYPADPWVHVEKISFRPTENLEFGFERTVIWGGKGHVPITIHSFLKSFFSFSAPNSAVKFSRNDPGARFGSFDFSYRLPWIRNWLTLYADSEVHDDVSPIDAPRRASCRPGFYLSHFPGLAKLDLRIEGVTTDPPVSTSNGGRFMYWEVVQAQGYTNAGQLLGDWIGREDKGAQAWLTYHLGGNEWLSLGFRNQKAAKDFIPGGTTLNNFNVQAVKRLNRDLELNAIFELERWKAPIYLEGQQTVTTTTVQLTWFPRRKADF
jgi:hypothetical protein